MLIGARRSENGHAGQTTPALDRGVHGDDTVAFSPEVTTVAGWEKRQLSDAPGRAAEAPPTLLKIIFRDNCFEKIRSRVKVLPSQDQSAAAAPRESDRFSAFAADLLTRSKRRRAQGVLKTSAWHWAGAAPALDIETGIGSER